MNWIFIIGIVLVGVLGFITMVTLGECGRWASLVVLGTWAAIALVFIAWGIHNHLTGALFFPWKAGGAAVSGKQVIAGGICLFLPALVWSIREFRRIKKDGEHAGGG